MHRKAILVLGMHRSGTSALARVLNLLGCDLPRTLMPGAHGNPQGHWESNAIAALNDALLQSGGSSWDDWLEFNPQWYQSPVADDFKARALQVLQEEYGASPLFVLKDPRNCRLTRFWFQVLDEAQVEPLIVLPIRNPLEVAESLEIRDSFPFDLAVLLWLRHVLDAEHGSRGRRRIFLTYEALLDDWTSLADAMKQTLDIQWPRLSIKAGMDVNAFLDKGNRHHVHSQQHVMANAMLSQWVREANSVLAKWAAEGENASDFAKLDTVRLELNAAGPAFARLTYALSSERQRNIELSDLIRRKDDEFSQANEAKSLLESEISRLSQLESAHALLEQQLAESQAAAHRNREDLAEGEAHIATLRDERQRLEQQVTEKDAIITSLDAEKTDLTQELQGMRQDIERITQSLNDRQHELAAAQSTLRQREEEIAQTLTLLNQERQRAEVAESACDMVRTEIETLEVKLKAADKWVFRLSSERRAAEQRLTLAEAQTAALEKALQSALTKLDNVARQRKLEADRQAELQSRIEAEIQARDNLALATEERLLQREREATQRLSQAQTEVSRLNTLLGKRDEDLALAQISNVSTQTRLAEVQKSLDLAFARVTEMEQREEDSTKQTVAIQQYKGRERELTALVESLRLQVQNTTQRWSASESKMIELSQLVDQREAALTHIRDASNAAQGRIAEQAGVIAEQSNEILRLSGDLQAIQGVRAHSDHQRKWLQQVNAVVTGYPQWWAFMPKKWRQKKVQARLLRKGLFDTDSYLTRYPDVLSSGIDPLQHYILHGMDEGRSI
ncbi:MAG: hypothetical protein QHC40_10995 [Sphingobium sp.]|nr:hypothetical protein [Sphingobium sp.]